ncbi:hypothetical protein Acsp04_64150 [Actinomadura sp. NBRC 104425]|uniref:hypothetical protein n=1 Tax=Actinomadura sp. NBRC 104425 TaxID=3032204 RepID=UPI0024A5927A|nr:hypothetical protein [Actinomadura sp. NBRC 104425]GLZ16180.1 hypothetical protein Acsp04_64150 [Actinomadura sp. NBRC 104425]
MTEQRGDVQELTDFELAVYEAVAEIDTDGGTAGLATLTRQLDRPEEDVRAALAHLLAVGHLRTCGTGFVLGPHDWSP